MTTAANAPCGHGTALILADFWPNALYDAREGVYRDMATTATMTMGGVMHYVSLDIGNLKRWFAGTIGATGTSRSTTTATSSTSLIVAAIMTGPPSTTRKLASSATRTRSTRRPVQDRRHQTTVLEGGEDRNERDGLQIYGARVENTVAGVLPGGAPAGNVAFERAQHR